MHSNHLNCPCREKLEVLPIECKFCDFDGTRFKVFISPDDLTTMCISLYMPCWTDLETHDVQGYLQQVYGDIVAAADPDYNFTLSINLKTLPSDYGITCIFAHFSN